MRRSRWRPRNWAAPPRSPTSTCRLWSLPMSNNDVSTRNGHGNGISRNGNGISRNGNGNGGRNGNGNGKGNSLSRAANAMPPLAEVLRKRRIMLTGATGFLGKVLLYLLLRHHPEIERIFLLIRGDRRSSLNRFRREILDSPAMAPLREHLGARFDRYVEEKIEIVAGDITEPDLITDTADTLGHDKLDAVIHCAGLVNFEASLEKAIAINTVGVANVIEFCRKRGAALLHVSTCYAAGGADGHRFEDDVPVDWCPNGRRNFNSRREIRDALAPSIGSKRNHMTRRARRNSARRAPMKTPIRAKRAITFSKRCASGGLKNGSRKLAASAH